MQCTLQTRIAIAELVTPYSKRHGSFAYRVGALSKTIYHGQHEYCGKNSGYIYWCSIMSVI